MSKSPDKAARRPSVIVTALIWMLAFLLTGFGTLAVIGANLRPDPSTEGLVVGYAIIGVGLLFGIWAARRKPKSDGGVPERQTVEEDPGFSWDASDSVEALEAAFRDEQIPSLPDGTGPGPIPPHIAGSLPLTADNLGGFMRSYPSNRAGIVRAFIMFSLLAALAFICIQMPHRKPPQPEEEMLVFGMFYGIAGVCGLLGFGILWTTLASAGRTFHLFENGVVEVTGNGSRAIQFAQIEQCSEISEFKLLTLHHINMYLFDLTENRGRLELDADTTRNAAELADFIQTRVFDRLLPQTVEAIYAGLKLSWGPVTLDSHGITFGSRATYAWNRVRSIGIARLGGSVVVNAGRFPKRTGIRADSIPNHQLLFRVSERLCTGG